MRGTKAKRLRSEAQAAQDNGLYELVKERDGRTAARQQLLKARKPRRPTASPGPNRAERRLKKNQPARYRDLVAAHSPLEKRRAAQKWQLAYSPKLRALVAARETEPLSPEQEIIADAVDRIEYAHTEYIANLVNTMQREFPLSQKENAA